MREAYEISMHVLHAELWKWIRRATSLCCVCNYWAWHAATGWRIDECRRNIWMHHLPTLLLLLLHFFAVLCLVFPTTLLYFTLEKRQTWRFGAERSNPFVQRGEICGPLSLQIKKLVKNKPHTVFTPVVLLSLISWRQCPIVVFWGAKKKINGILWKKMWASSSGLVSRKSHAFRVQGTVEPGDMHVLPNMVGPNTVGPFSLNSFLVGSPKLNMV